MGKRYRVTYDDGTTAIVDESELIQDKSWLDFFMEAASQPFGMAPSEPAAGKVLAPFAREIPAAIPGPLGVAGAGVGSLSADMLEGDTPSLSRAAGAVGGAGAGMGLGSALSKLRLFGVGRGGDAQRVAASIRRQGTPLQPERTVEDLQAVMRGRQGLGAMERSRDLQEQALRQRLPPDPAAPSIDTDVLNLPASPALARGQFGSLMDQLKTLGRQGFSRTGPRDAAAAAAARESREQVTRDIERLLATQDPTGDALRQFREMQKQWSAAMEMRRTFEPTGKLSPERILTPKGFEMADLQGAVTKRQGSIESRLPRPQDFLSTVFRGGSPPSGDRQLMIPLSIRGGMRIPLPGQWLAGQGVHRPEWQALLQLLGAPTGAGLSDLLGGL